MRQLKERTRQKVKLMVMIGLTFSFFLVEIVVGYMTGSLALVSDSFHMISDVLALIIGLSCLWLSTKESKTNTYGWARTEIIGALINSVFLIALCFSIFTEALQRMVNPEPIHSPDLLLVVGGVGLGVNLLGLLIFCNETIGHHGHSHGGEGHSQGKGGHSHGHSHNHKGNSHGHSHDHEGHSHGHSHDHEGHSHGHSHDHNGHSTHDKAAIENDSTVYQGMNLDDGVNNPAGTTYIVINTGNEQMSDDNSTLDDKTVATRNDSKACLDGEENGAFASETQDGDDEPDNVIRTLANIVSVPITEVSLDDPEQCPPKKVKKIKTGGQMNIQGVFLHILGDALGSVVVIISALLIKYFDDDWVLRVDPALSLLMVLIILSSTIPLFKQSALILLQNVPKDMNVDDLAEKMRTEVAGISNIHDLHVWQLVGNRVIASMHVRCSSLTAYVEASKKIKTFLHENGIHSSTIQPEFMEHKDKPTTRECYLECGPDLQCFVNTCCSSKKSEKKSASDTVTEQPAVFTSFTQTVVLPEVADTDQGTRL